MVDLYRLLHLCAVFYTAAQKNARQKVVGVFLCVKIFITELRYADWNTVHLYTKYVSIT